METDKETLTIQTPEQVGFQYALAGLGTRATAFILDTAIRALLILFIFVVVFSISRWLPRLDATGMLKTLPRNWILALGILAYGVIDLGYFLIFEALWSGQTPGKRSQGLRVMRVDGQPIGWLESALRNILRALDMLAGFYPIGLVVMFLSPRSQRIGDYAAGTVVIRERQYHIPTSGVPTSGIATSGVSQSRVPEDRSGTGAPGAGMDLDIEPYVSRLEPRQYEVLRSFLQRRGGMDPNHRKEISGVLCARLFEIWGISPVLKGSREAFIEEVVGMYERTRRAI